MIKGLLLFVSFQLLGFNSQGQKPIACSGLEKLPGQAKPILKGFEIHVLKKSDLSNTLYIIPPDPSYKIMGFVASYDCHGLQSAGDLNSKTYLGNNIPAGDNFIKHVRVNDLFVIDCINVEKNGKTYLLAAFFLDVIE